jgi:signal transduction histidine kinase
MTVGAVAVILAVSLIVFNIALRNTLSDDADRIAQTRAEAGLEVVEVSDEEVALIDAQPPAGRLNSGAWIFFGNELIRGPNADPALSQDARAVIQAPRGFTDIDDPSARLYVLPIERNDKRLGTVVGAVRLGPYERTSRLALFGSIALALAVLAGLGVLTWWALNAALRPVSQMTALAARWSDHDLDERFALGQPHDEITQLGRTLDQLLDRVAAGMRRERRLSAEIAHELRTPTSRIAAEAELAISQLPSAAREQRSALEAISAETRRISTTIDALVSSADGARNTAPGVSSASTVLAEVIDAASPLLDARGVRLTTVAAEEISLGIEQKVATQILRPVLENAIAYCRSGVSIGAQRVGPSIEVVIEDDGPGLVSDEADAIFEPGRRGTAAATSNHSGVGLGLPLARRLARGVGGEVSADASAAGGRFVIQLPSG